MPSRHLKLAGVAAAVVAATTLAGCLAPPEDLTCTATSEGILLEWSPVENATEYTVWTFFMDEAGVEVPVPIANTTETSYLDTDVEAGQTYAYFVTAHNETAAGEPSEVCEVTAVPFVPGPMVGALALVGAVGCYAVLRRRKA